MTQTISTKCDAVLLKSFSKKCKEQNVTKSEAVRALIDGIILEHLKFEIEMNGSVKFVQVKEND
jgi:antitoxin component of RelBE/YafQ-DinJ toxin-antitoxin module